MNSSISKPREDLRTRSTFSEQASASSSLHSSQTRLQSSPELVCDWLRVPSSRQTRSNVARMSVSTLGVYSKSGSRMDFMSELLGVLVVTPCATARWCPRRVAGCLRVSAASACANRCKRRRRERSRRPRAAAPQGKADRFALAGGPNPRSGHDLISRDTLDEAELRCSINRLGPSLDHQLPEDAFGMRLDGLGSDAQLSGDHFVGQPVAHQEHDRSFASRQAPARMLHLLGIFLVVR